MDTAKINKFEPEQAYINLVKFFGALNDERDTAQCQHYCNKKYEKSCQHHRICLITSGTVNLGRFRR
jgi:hypothetical protein